jgi:predicted methyltransferase
MAQHFVEQFAVRFPVFTDPDRSSYRLAGLKRSLGLGLRTLKHARRAIAAGNSQGKTAGDPWQQGGVLIVDPDGTVVWRHVNGEAGDHADIDAILGQLAAA